MKDLSASLGRLSTKDTLDRLSIWGFAGVGVCTALYALTSLALPFGWDHGIIAAAGAPYVQGGLPYADSWDMKGPVAYLPFAAAEFLFGRTMWGVRLLDLLAWAITGFVLYDGVRVLTTWRIGLATALVTYLWMASAGWFFSAAPESWVTASCVLAIVPLLRPDATLKLPGVALSGFLIACAGLVKPFYFGFGLAPLLAVALSFDVSLWRRAQLAGALAAGALLPPALICGYFALLGGLSQAIEVHVLYPLSTYVASTSGWETTLYGLKAFLVTPPLLITLPFALLSVWFWRSQIRVLGPLLAWLAVAVLCVAAQGKYFVYHWFPAYPPIFILGALGVFGVLQVKTRPALISLIVAVGAAALLTAVVARPVRDVVKFSYYRILKQDPQRYYASYRFRMYDAADEIAAAKYIAAHTHPQQGVFIWGSDGTVGYLANRPNPSRFTFAMPLSLPGDYRAPYRAEVMRELTARPPTYFVVGISWQGLSKEGLSPADFPEMASFLSENYSLERSIGVMDLYRLRGAAPNTDASQ